MQYFRFTRWKFHYLQYIRFMVNLLRFSFHPIDRLQNDSEENIQTIPTIGFNVEVLQYKNIKFQVLLSPISSTLRSPLSHAVFSLVYRSGILEGKQVFDPIGVAIIRTQTQLFSLWTRAMGSVLALPSRSCWRCSRRMSWRMRSFSYLPINKTARVHIMPIKFRKRYRYLIFATGSGRFRRRQHSRDRDFSKVWSMNFCNHVGSKTLSPSYPLLGFDWLVTCIKGGEAWAVEIVLYVNIHAQMCRSNITGIKMKGRMTYYLFAFFFHLFSLCFQSSLSLHIRPKVDWRL